MAAAIRLSQQHSCSFDDLVDAGEQRRRHGEAEHPGGLGADDQLEPSVFATLAGLTSTATRIAAGTSSRRSSSRFATNSPIKKLTPVRLPPGRARLATRPSLTGSSAALKTMGVVVVTALTANAEGAPPLVAITATCRRTSSAASSGRRSYCLSAQRYSIATFSPSTWPLPSSPREMHAGGPRTFPTMWGSGSQSPALPAAARARRAHRNPSLVGRSGSYRVAYHSQRRCAGASADTSGPHS